MPIIERVLEIEPTMRTLKTMSALASASPGQLEEAHGAGPLWDCGEITARPDEPALVATTCGGAFRLGTVRRRLVKTVISRALAIKARVTRRPTTILAWLRATSP